jgi:hypothetical protein
VKKSGPGGVIAKAELVAKSAAKMSVLRIAFIFFLINISSGRISPSFLWWKKGGYSG